MSKLEPGQELDKLIHDKVFGNPKPLMNFKVARVKSIDPKNGTITLEDESLIPPYSTSIEAAWEIVEKFNLFNLTHGLEGWTCRIGLPVENDRWIGIEQIQCSAATTAPHVICIAALQAVNKQT